MKLYVSGHNGWGDNLHQRDGIRRLLEQGDEVWLETSTPCVYHDLIDPKLHLVSSRTTLRTQAKNIQRESAAFELHAPPRHVHRMRLGYGKGTVERAGSVARAMTAAFGFDLAADEHPDFRMPVPVEWAAKLPADLPPQPWIVYRPPVERREWAGAGPRNPDVDAYAEIFAAIRGARPTVSVADLADGLEWIVGKQPAVDRTYHRGELDFEALCVLVLRSSFVYTTPGLLTVLAQALEVPCVTVFGGFESAASFSGGAVYSPWLPIEPISPCACWSNYHSCDKRLDVPLAIERARRFLDEWAGDYGSGTTATPGDDRAGD